MRTTLTRSVAVVAAVTLGLAACGTDDDGVTEPTDTTTTTVADTTTTTVDDTTTTVDTTTTTTVDETTTTTTTVPDLDQPAIWPADDVVFTDPREAAEDFVFQVLGVPPAVGEFEPGDARSGEIDVFSLGEGPDAEQLVRGRLLLRQLGESGGWFVIGAVNEFASIDVPEPNADVPAGMVTVEGVARGFEATVIVSAFRSGDAEDELDQQLTMGGAFETPEPFSVEVDLSGASPGDVVAILVRGGVGLETDPGEFGAIAVVIADSVN
jgi:hypothetical protein